MFTDLLSNQCIYNVTVESPEKDIGRALGSVLSHMNGAKGLVNHHQKVDGFKSLVDCFPKVAVMEVILNAVVHRNYLVKEDIGITVLEDCVTMVSSSLAFKYITESGTKA